MCKLMFLYFARNITKTKVEMMDFISNHGNRIFHKSALFHPKLEFGENLIFHEKYIVSEIPRF